MEDRAPQLYAVTITVLALVWISAFLRCYVRGFIVKSFGVDDYLMVLSALTFSMYCGFVFTGLHYGTGKHAWDLQEANMLKGIHYWYFCEWGYAISTTVMKVSIGAFFLRIAVELRHIQIIWVLIIVNVLFGFSYMMCAVLQCVPTNYIWLKYAANPPPRSSARCLSDEFQVWGSIAHSILCAVSDWALALLPIAMLWGTAMNNRTKATVIFLMGLGALASTATLVRISYLHTVDTKTDFLWVTFDVAIWSTIEGVGIAANGLATLRPLFRAILSSTTTGGSHSSYHLDSNPLSTLSNNGKKEKRLHMNLRHSNRLSSNDRTPYEFDSYGMSILDSSRSTSQTNFNFIFKETGTELEMDNKDHFSGRGRDLTDTWDMNETSKWRPDNHKLGKLTTTVTGGGPNLYSEEEEIEGEIGDATQGRSCSGSRASSKSGGKKNSRPQMVRGITKVTEFSIEDRKARLSELAGTSLDLGGLQNRSISEDARYQR